MNNLEAYKISGVGIDLIEIERFRRFSKNIQHVFLKKVFSKEELIYFFKYKDPIASLAGIFAAKEASSKALGVTKFPFNTLEIRHHIDGAPQVWRDGKKLPVKISITHTNTTAAAFAVV
jgi:holo-[acyl-carrier protein] synthase